MAFLSGGEMRSKMRMVIVRRKVRPFVRDKWVAQKMARKYAWELGVDRAEIAAILSRVEEDTVAANEAEKIREALQPALDAMEGRITTQLTDLSTAIRNLTNYVIKNPPGPPASSNTP